MRVGITALVVDNVLMGGENLTKGGGFYGRDECFVSMV